MWRARSIVAVDSINIMVQGPVGVRHHAVIMTGYDFSQM